jgi:serine phosphatase RsbU (regulator of sigma subunit)
MPHFGMVGFITSKKHTVIVGGLLLVIITCQVVSSNDEFFLASAPNFYMNVIGYAAALYFLVNFSEKFVGDIILSHKKLSIKGREITDSLNYAKRIQRSHLPSVLQIQKTLQDSFVLNKPKDIVSGDFYFFKEQGPKVFLAVADCTGHGVPGALLSILANEKLDASVRQSTDTSKILRLVNQKIKRALRQSDLENENYDGMDIALCSLDLDTQILCFAGANRPVWIIRSGANQVEEVKPTKASIAGHTRNEQNYQTHELQLNAGDSFYLFSDGFADTFGGKNGKKLMTKKFKSLLLDIQSKSMDEQGSYLDTYIDEWKRGLDQCDDILVIGVRV